MKVTLVPTSLLEHIYRVTFAPSASSGEHVSIDFGIFSHQNLCSCSSPSPQCHVCSALSSSKGEHEASDTDGDRIAAPEIDACRSVISKADPCSSTRQPAKDSCQSTKQPAKDSCQSTRQPAKDGCRSTKQPAKDGCRSATPVRGLVQLRFQMPHPRGFLHADNLYISSDCVPPGDRAKPASKSSACTSQVFSYGSNKPCEDTHAIVYDDASESTIIGLIEFSLHCFNFNTICVFGGREINGCTGIRACFRFVSVDSGCLCVRVVQACSTVMAGRERQPLPAIK